MESIGARLKRLRLEKGLSLEEAHKRTKIHLNILKAIEEDALLGFSPTYIKGFLKIYCKFLGVDSDQYIEDSRRQESKPVILPRPPRQVQPASFIKKPAAGQGKAIQFINLKVIIISCCVLMLVVVLLALGKFVSGRWSLYQKEKKASAPARPAKAKKPKAASGKSKIKETPKPRNKNKAKAEVPGSVSVKQGQVPAGVDIRLGMRAREDCWVNLKADGRVVFHGILRKGKFESWQAKQKIEFSLGNAGVIELELNGKIIPPLGRKGQSLKSVSVTKTEGLVIGR